MSVRSPSIRRLDALHDRLRPAPPLRCANRPFPMDPCGRHGMQPRALTGQAARQEAHALPGLLAAVLVRPQPRPALGAALPRGLVPEPQHGRAPLRRPRRAAPGQQRGGLGADRAACPTPPPPRCRPGGPMADPQTIAGQGVGAPLGAGPRALVPAPGRGVGWPAVARRLGHAPPPDRLAPAPSPRRRGGGQGPQPGASFFFGATPERGWCAPVWRVASARRAGRAPGGARRPCLAGTCAPRHTPPRRPRARSLDGGGGPKCGGSGGAARAPAHVAWRCRPQGASAAARRSAGAGPPGPASCRRAARGGRCARRRPAPRQSRAPSGHEPWRAGSDSAVRERHGAIASPPAGSAVRPRATDG